jgi:Sec-independent protein secretion pathway component TatC
MPGVDPVTLLFTMIPLLLLFEMSIWLAVFFDRRWQRAADAREAAFEAGSDV